MRVLSKGSPPQQEKQRYDHCVSLLKASRLKVETGRFGANIQVAIANDGPVTLWLEKESEI